MIKLEIVLFSDKLLYYQSVPENAIKTYFSFFPSSFLVQTKLFTLEEELFSFFMMIIHLVLITLPGHNMWNEKEQEKTTDFKWDKTAGINNEIKAPIL